MFRAVVIQSDIGSLLKDSGIRQNMNMVLMTSALFGIGPADRTCVFVLISLYLSFYFSVHSRTMPADL